MNNNNLFCSCKTLDELKKAYRAATLANHPDRGGDVEAMKRVNLNYEEAFNYLKSAHNAAADEAHQTTETPEEFRAILEALLKLDGLTIELCGSWLWISGDTFTHKDALKAAGCRWSNNKKMWYWRHEEDGHKWRRGKSTMADIRAKYGSQRFGSYDDAPELAAC